MIGHKNETNWNKFQLCRRFEIYTFFLSAHKDKHNKHKGKIQKLNNSGVLEALTDTHR